MSSKRAWPGVLGVLVLLIVAIVAVRAYWPRSVGEIQVADRGPYRPGQKILVGLDSGSDADVVYKWSSPDGTFEGPSDGSSARFVVPDQDTAHIVCDVSVGGKTSEHVVTVPVVRNESGGSGAPPQGQGGGSATLPDGGAILNNLQMGSNLGLGVDTSEHKRDWVKPMTGKDGLILAFPGDPGWGAVFFTVGPSRDDHRPGADMSAFNTLEVELKGQQAGDIVYVGIKDATQPDNGSEWKEKVTLTTDWVKYPFPLSKFVGADVHRLYVLCEFVFGDSPTTVYVRRIQYVKNN